MILRRCPKCGERHYSADTRDVNWECRNCGQEIPKKQEEPADGGKCRTDGPCARHGYTPDRHWCAARNCLHHVDRVMVNLKMEVARSERG